MLHLEFAWGKIRSKGGFGAYEGRIVLARAEEFRETKHIHWDFSMEEEGWWYPYEQYNRESGYTEE